MNDEYANHFLFILVSFQRYICFPRYLYPLIFIQSTVLAHHALL